MKIHEGKAAGLRQALRNTDRQVSEEELTTENERTHRKVKGDPGGEAWDVKGRESLYTPLEGVPTGLNAAQR